MRSSRTCTPFPYTTLFRSTYAGSKAVIDIVTEGRSVGGIDTSLIDGFQIDVEESTDSRLSLKIGPAAARSSTDRKSTRLNSSHRCISYAVFCLKKKNKYKV